MFTKDGAFGPKWASIKLPTMNSRALKIYFLAKM